MSLKSKETRIVNYVQAFSSLHSMLTFNTDLCKSQRLFLIIIAELSFLLANFLGVFPGEQLKLACLNFFCDVFDRKQLLSFKAR